MSEEVRAPELDQALPSAVRPETAGAPPTTAGTERERWSDDGSEEDDDPGMFSFLRPVTAAGPPSTAPLSPLSGPLSSHFRDNTASTFSDAPFLHAPVDNPHAGQSYSSYPVGFPSSQSIPTSLAQSAVLSPAAAYALASQRSSDGPRRRGSWQYPESPEGETPSRQLETSESRTDSQRSDGTLDKSTGYGYGDWDGGNGHDRSELSTGYGLDRHGMAIPMSEMGSDGMKLGDDDKMTTSGSISMGGMDGFMMGEEEEEDSPYPEVRASVSNIDDPEMPCLTFRSWGIGLTFTCLVSCINLFFMFRYPAPIITPIIVQVVSYPIGKLLAYVLPATVYRTPGWMQKMGFSDELSLNPGPFNIKEHTVIIIMANAATSQAYALNFSVASEKFYGIAQGTTFDILLVVTTQMIGFGMAGLCRRFLVWPAALIWPQNLVFCTLLNTLHAEDDDGNSGGLTRYRFFTYVICGAFFWYLLPGFLFQALSVFSFICWAAPNNAVVNQLFGLSSGLGMSLITFDWAQIAYIGSPLVVPWWAQVNVFVGFLCAFWIFAPAMYYSNVWQSAYLPISTSQVFDRFGNSFNTSRVLDMTTLTLNTTAYAEYSPLYLPITYATVYGLAFALSTASIVHTIIYHGKDILDQAKNVRGASEDVHAKLMRNYPEVPDWWYWAYLVLFTALSIITISVWNTQMPVWALLVSLTVAFIYVLPGGFIFAMTSQQITINLIVELMGGYMMPGQPLGNMLFKVYTAQAVGLSLSFVQDLKLGHYMKLPPRATFAIQVVATFISCILQVMVKEWLVGNIPDLCDPKQAALLICPSTTVFYSSSIIWGLIGPARQFGIGMTYNPILWAILGGALLPIPFWLLGRKYPNSWLKYVNIPVLLTGATYMPPATGINYSSWFLFGFIFQFWMRRSRFRWWSKFNFVLSAGLDSGTVLSGLFIFFALQLPRSGTISVNWWGNSVFENTADWNGVSYLTVPDAGFGPDKWII